MTKLTVFLLLISTATQAADWLCQEEASQRQGALIQACGVGSGQDEDEARTRAFENAQAEFERLCEASDDCRGHRVRVAPARTSCEAHGETMQCYRLLIFQIGPLGPRGHLGKQISKRRDPIRPFSSEELANFPKVGFGMTKAQVLKAFGTPASAHQTLEDTWFMYRGPMCPDPMWCSIRFNSKGRVDGIRGVDYRYTEVMK